MNNPDICRLCGEAGEMTEIISHETWRLFECGLCGAQFWWPLEHPGKKFYDNIRDADFSATKTKSMLSWAERRFLKKTPFKSGRILDVGCGTGDFLAAAKSAGFETWGVDISEKTIQSAKTNYGLENVFTADFEEFAHRADLPKFDIITVFEVLEHLTDPPGFLKKIKNLLKPEGFLIFAVPNLERVGKKNEHWDYPPHHFWRWRKRVLKKFLEHENFSVKEIVEQPYGPHILYEKGLFSFGIIKYLKSKRKHINLAQKFSKQIIKAADFKNLFLVKIATPFFFPIALLGHILGWKYVELYCVAKLNKS